VLREQGERREPHRGEYAEERCERAEGRTLVHGSKQVSDRAPERFDADARHPSRAVEAKGNAASRNGHTEDRPCGRPSLDSLGGAF